MSVEQQQIGPYRILRLLGYGSLGEVYLVEDTRSSGQGVLKLYRTGVSSPQNIYALQQEAQALIQIYHPNILSLTDFGETMINGIQTPYTVMPYWPEGMLATWLQQNTTNGILAPQDVALVVRQLADGLQFAHDRGIIHKDVKPTNVFIRQRGTYGAPDVLIGDFALGQMAAIPPGTGQNFRGNPIYMAPEQWSGHAVPETDQYALAVLAYQLLTGRAPFQGNLEQLRYEHSATWPPLPSTLNPALPPQLDPVLLRALSKQPGERFPNIAAFAAAFQQALQAPTVLPPPDQGTTISDMPVVTPPPERRGLPTAAIVTITALALILLGLVGFLIFQSSRNNPMTSAAPTATAQAATATAEGASNGATATTNSNNATATAGAQNSTNANATATAKAQANANATATAKAESSNANATATAKAASSNTNATATAGANATATAVAPAAQISGNWNNVNTASTGLTRVTITNSGTTISVHPFAKSGTGESDWGTQKQTYTGSPITLDFNHDGQTDILTLSLNSDGSQLKIVDVGPNGVPNGPTTTQTYFFKKV